MHLQLSSPNWFFLVTGSLAFLSLIKASVIKVWEIALRWHRILDRILKRALGFSIFVFLFLFREFLCTEVPSTDKSLLPDAGFGHHKHMDIFSGEKIKPHIETQNTLFLWFKTHVVIGILFFGWSSPYFPHSISSFAPFANLKRMIRNGCTSRKKWSVHSQKDPSNAGCRSSKTVLSEVRVEELVV